jgi:hypothetical protein
MLWDDIAASLLRPNPQEGTNDEEKRDGLFIAKIMFPRRNCRDIIPASFLKKPDEATGPHV